MNYLPEGLYSNSDVSRVFWGTPFSAGGLEAAVTWQSLSGGPGGKAPESFWDLVI